MGSKSLSQSIVQDQRTDVGGMAGGQLAAPGAQVTGTGSLGIRAGDYSNVSTTIKGLKMGMTGAEVRELLAQTSQAFKDTTAGVMDYAKSAIATTQAAQTGELPNWQRYIPYAIAGLVLMAVIWRSSK